MRDRETYDKNITLIIFLQLTYKIMKGENRLKILEFVERSAKLIEDIFFIFSLPYGTPYSRIDYLLQKRHIQTFEVPRGKKEKMRFSDLIYRLKKEGLVCEVKKENENFLGLTNKGKIILEKFRSAKNKSLPMAKYENKEEETLKIVIFDIPESEKRKRDWLRSALRNLRFRMLQKSVWAGKASLPQEFIEDLRKINLLPFVEIFSVSKTGSLMQFKK